MSSDSCAAVGTLPRMYAAWMSFRVAMSAPNALSQLSAPPPQLHTAQGILSPPDMLSFVRVGFEGSCSSDSVRATSLFAASRAADPDTNEVMSCASPLAVSTVPAGPSHQQSRSCTTRRFFDFASHCLLFLDGPFFSISY